DNLNGTALKAWFDLNGNNQTLTSLALAGGGASNSQTTAAAVGDNRIGNSSTTVGTLTLANSTSFTGVIGGGPGDNLALALGSGSTATFQFTGANTFAAGTTINTAATLKG